MRGDCIHPEILSILAGMGHGQTIVIGDAGLPVPKGVTAVSLLVSPGVPSFLDVLNAVMSAMHVERIFVAHETAENSPFVWKSLQSKAGALPIEMISHDQLKTECENSVAVIRTGEYTPYANVILQCGVAF